jgi:hypothetical protein
VTGDDLVVTGGRGGTTARLDDLRTAARALLGAAERLDRAGAIVDHEADWLRARVPIAPSAATWALGSLDRVRHGSTSLPAAAQRCRALASGLDRAADTYQQAESTADRVARTFIGASGSALAFLLRATPFSGLATAVVVEETGLATVAEAAGSAEGLTSASLIAAFRRAGAERLVAGLGGVVDGMLPSPLWGPRSGRSPVERAAADLTRGLPRRPMAVTATSSPEIAPIRSTSDAAQAIQTAYGAGPGSVIVQRVDHADGSRGWVVAIPGTQSMSLGAGSNPFDNRTNLAAMAGVADDSSALVAGALLSSGARAGEAVLLAGHSQGGMVAARLAGDPAFAGTYRVRSVLTMGSPIGAMAVPATTQALAMENLSDTVPAVDGTPNPDVPNVTTVKRDLSTSSDPRDVAATGSLFASHDLDRYAQTADEVDASDHPSIVAWREAAVEVTGAPGDSVTTTVYQGTRLEPARAPAEPEHCRSGPVLPFPLGPLSPIVPLPFGPSSATIPIAPVPPLATIPLAPTVPRLSDVRACPNPRG